MLSQSYCTISNDTRVHVIVSTLCRHDHQLHAIQDEQQLLKKIHEAGLSLYLYLQ